MKRIFLFAAITFCSAAAFAQKLTPAQYIEMHKDLAIREMKRMGIPAAITLAQGLLETENGNSELLKKSNNHFGIKCKSSWTAGGVSHDDDAPGECFRTYKDAEASYRDHSNYLRGQDRYASLFRLEPTDYKGWAYGLKKAGYATNPRYPAILIKFIEDNNLQQYTLLAVNDVPRYDGSKFKDDPIEKATDEITTSTVKVDHDKLNQTGTKLTVNGITAIYAEKGRSLLAIATENKINLAKLLEYNDLEKDGLLEKDQFIFLDKKSKEGKENFYTVLRGENLHDVAQKNGIRKQNLYEYNDLKDDNISAGARLRLRPDAPQQEVASEKNIQKEKVHEVQPKEGLYGISKKYGVTVSQLREWNNLADDNLKIGQQLIISK